jgi:hypothetical protein
MLRISENGARPVCVPGEGNPPPYGRLGALVFQPNNSDTLWWASLSAATRIAGWALGACPTNPCWKNVASEKRSRDWLGWGGPTDLTTPTGRLETSGGYAAKSRISFSLWTVVAKHAREYSRPEPRLWPGADVSAIHGQTERSGCTAAEPYPLSCSYSIGPRRCRGQENEKMKN